MDEITLRALVDLRDRTLQKSRIAFNNRLSAIERGDDQVSNGTVKLLERWFERFVMLEGELDDDIRNLIHGDELVEYMTEVKGVGEILSAKVISMIDIERADTVSALWRYAGYGVINGEREKPIKGEKLHYNKRLKSTCYLIGSSFLKSNSPYRQIYDNAKEYYEINRTDWTKLHRHNAAMRKMIKVWLSHLWEVWRKIEGLPVRNIYAEGKLGHNHYIKPRDYGWPEIQPERARVPVIGSEPLTGREPDRESEPIPMRYPKSVSEPITAREL